MSWTRLRVRVTQTASLVKPCRICRLQCAVSNADTNWNAPRTWTGQLPSLPPGTQKRVYGSQTIDYARMREDADSRARRGFYAHAYKQKSLLMSTDKAYSIYADFVHCRNKLSHKDNVLRLTKKYNVDLESVASLALVTYKIPDFSDPEKRARLPSSQHKTVASQMLDGCAYNNDPLSIVHILTATHLADTTSDRAARDITGFFPRKDILAWRGMLDGLCENSQKIALGPDALTLKALLLQSEGQKQEAQDLLLLAIKRSTLQYQPGSRHPMQYPLMAPWNAIGYLLMSSKDPRDHGLAKTYFEMGATEADDPLSCHELSLFEPELSEKRLKYMSKAAASGHREAIVNLARFYTRMDENPSIIQSDDKLSKTLNWLTRWKKDALKSFSVEWLKVASSIGHEPSTTQLIQLGSVSGDKNGAKEYPSQTIEKPKRVPGRKISTPLPRR